MGTVVLRMRQTDVTAEGESGAELLLPIHSNSTSINSSCCAPPGLGDADQDTDGCKLALPDRSFLLVVGTVALETDEAALCLAASLTDVRPPGKTPFVSHQC